MKNLLLLISALIVSSMANARVSKIEMKEREVFMDPIFKAAEEYHKLPRNLLKSICWAESNWDHKAVNSHDGGSNNHATGTCQVLITTAEYLNQRDYTECRIPKKELKVSEVCELMDPMYNAMTAAKFISRLIKRHRGDITKVVASYNSGSPKYKGGVLVNQRYVDKVLDQYRRLNR